MKRINEEKRFENLFETMELLIELDRYFIVGTKKEKYQKGKPSSTKKLSKNQTDGLFCSDCYYIYYSFYQNFSEPDLSAIPKFYF